MTMRFYCDLDVPRTEEETGIPTSWLRDRQLTVGASGLLFRMLVSLPPGASMTDADLEETRHPDDLTVEEAVEELRAAGYLCRSDDGDGAVYEVVHPDRLGPLPTA